MRFSFALECVCDKKVALTALLPLPPPSHTHTFSDSRKISFKRLHKALRRAGGASASIAAAALGDDDAVSDADVTVVDAPAALAAGGASAPLPPVTSSPATAKGPAAKGGKGAASVTGAAAPSHAALLNRAAQNVFQRREWHPLPLPALTANVAAEAFGAVETIYSRVSRHAIDARDDAAVVFEKEHSSACQEIEARFDAALKEADKWDDLWNARLLSLRQRLTDGETTADA